MLKIGRFTKVSAFVIAAGLVASACSSSSSATTSAAARSVRAAPKTIVIGATLPLTGSGAPYGQTFLSAIKIAADYINQHGGVNGAKIKVVALDDQALAAPAIIDTKQLISADHALVVATAYNDPPLAQYKIGQADGVPIINGGGNDPALLNRPYLWNTASIFTNEEVVAFDYAKSHGTKSVGIIAATNYTNYDINLFEKIADNIFGGSQKLVTFAPTATNVTSQLQELQAAHPDVISPMTSGTLTLTVAEDMDQLGMKEKVVGIDGMLTVPANIVKQPAWNGAIGGVPVAPPSSWLEARTKAQTGSDATVYSTYFANIPFVVKDAVLALEKAGKSVTGANINAFLESSAKSGTAIDGSNGPITFQSNHTVELAYTASQVQPDGSLKVLQTLSPSQVAAEVRAAKA